VVYSIYRVHIACGRFDSKCDFEFDLICFVFRGLFDVLDAVLIVFIFYAYHRLAFCIFCRHEFYFCFCLRARSSAGWFFHAECAKRAKTGFALLKPAQNARV